jgi:hypothetical protein
MGKDVMPLTFELVDLKFDFVCELFCVFFLCLFVAFILQSSV